MVILSSTILSEGGKKTIKRSQLLQEHKSNSLKVLQLFHAQTHKYDELIMGCKTLMTLGTGF